MAKKGWRELPRGGVIKDPGSASKYRTGSWRVKRPLWSEEKCIQCLLCHVYCPDIAIDVEEGKVIGIDYNHCKGCGICANQCPVQALEMISEDKGDVNDETEEVDHQKKSE
ncbi:pyruvate synthase subunit PorD [Halothermothrix orenii]|uniref:Pyruvate synthase subunit PorD n=1 Tax=Halothermothrix orenii (strain H 168 / OCM 544 / DSM 9562) TaxID=373903 RepID=B8CZW6_HALOH|nr:pyruvate synthase subunit PorD [Halothermothrix orenii]ACL70818.1 pyruvate ferredoxin oxidoreductase, delta subunit [Halothermothrix orenii H 168]